MLIYLCALGISELSMRRRYPKRRRYGKTVTGKRRSSTHVRGHRRRKPSGGMTYVRPYRRRVMKNVYGRVPYPVLVFRTVEKTIVHKSVNAILSGLSLTFPQYSPIVEIGRFVFNNRSKFIPFFKRLLATKAGKDKIDGIEKAIEKGVKKEFVKEFSQRTSAEISLMIDERIGFNEIVRTVSRDFTETDVEIIKGFFDKSLEKLILESSMKVIGLD
jgi:hypothetical protein